MWSTYANVEREVSLRASDFASCLADVTTVSGVGYLCRDAEGLAHIMSYGCRTVNWTCSSSCDIDLWVHSATTGRRTNVMTPRRSPVEHCVDYRNSLRMLVWRVLRACSRLIALAISPHCTEDCQGFSGTLICTCCLQLSWMASLRHLRRDQVEVPGARGYSVCTAFKKPDKASRNKFVRTEPTVLSHGNSGVLPGLER